MYIKFCKYVVLLCIILKYYYLIWKQIKMVAWFKRHKNDKFFKYFENASWFKWYGKKVVYVKPKKDTIFKGDKRDVAEAIKCKDYKKARDILDTMNVSPQTVALRQIIETKLKEDYNKH